MLNVQIILNFIDERLKKIHKPDPELVKKHNADPLNKDWQIPEGALWENSLRIVLTWLFLDCRSILILTFRIGKLNIGESKTV